jgi:hypothetical protein
MKYKFLIGIPMLMMLVDFVSAATTSTVGSSMQAVGPMGIIGDIGLSQVMPVMAAFGYYRFIAFAIIIALALTGDRNTQTIFSILIVCFAAIFAYIGWFTVLDKYGNIDPTGPWSIVILCAVLVVFSYFTEQKRVGWGLNNAGDPVVNIFMFFVIFNSCLGLMAYTNIYGAIPGMATSPTACTTNSYSNCQVNGATLMGSLSTPTGSGGIFGQVADLISQLPSMALGAIVFILTLALSMAAVSATILITYPWMYKSPPAVAFLGIFQIICWIFYYLMYTRMIGKVMPGELRL